MPWTSKSSKRHTKKAKSAKSKRMWADIANSVLKRTGDEGKAVRIANGVIKKGQKKKHHKKHAHKKIASKR